jgi:hypothetical protein
MSIIADERYKYPAKWSVIVCAERLLSTGLAARLVPRRRRC